MNDKENKLSNDIDELEKLKKQAVEYLDGWKRAKADYINLKKETESQSKEIKWWLSKVMLLPLLEIMDSFDKAVGGIPENIKNEAWTNGVISIKKQFTEYLKNQGVEAMVVFGERFDPAKHEAIELIEEKDKSGMVAEELLKGYLINGEVLRPAKVKIYK